MSFERSAIEYEPNCGYDSLKIEYIRDGSSWPTKEEILCGEFDSEEFEFGPGTVIKWVIQQ